MRMYGFAISISVYAMKWKLSASATE